MRQHLAGIGDQQRKEAVLDGREMQYRARLADDSVGLIDFYIAEPEDAVAIGRCRRLPPQGRTHARQQFADAERLREVVVRAGIERGDLVGFVDASRQHDHRDRRPAAKRMDEIDTVSVGEPEIENDEIRLARAGIGEALLQRGGLEDVPPFGFERGPNEAPDLRLVLDQERDRRRGTHGASSTRLVACSPAPSSRGAAGGIPNGSVKQKRAPPCGGFSAQIFPR